MTSFEGKRSRLKSMKCTKYYQHNLSCNCVSSCISDAKPTSKRQCYAMLDNGVCADEEWRLEKVRSRRKHDHRKRVLCGMLMLLLA